MRPITFDSSVLRQHLLRHKIAELPELKRVLGTDTAVTVFRKLKQLGYLASYTHRGRFYTLPEIARFDDRGLWSHEAVWFSRYGTLLSTVEAFVLGSSNGTSNGYYAHELADVLHAEVQELRPRPQPRQFGRVYVIFFQFVFFLFWTTGTAAKDGHRLYSKVTRFLTGHFGRTGLTGRLSPLGVSVQYKI